MRLPPRRHSAMFGDVLIVTTKGRGKWYQDVVGRSQGCCQHLKMHGTVPTSKNYPAPDVNSPDYTLILYRHMEKKRLQDSITARFHCFLKYLFIDFIYLFIFWPCRTACWILVPRPGIEPLPPAVEARSLNHWTTREVPRLSFFIQHNSTEIHPSCCMYQ